MGLHGNNFDSLRRRLRYGAWRTAYILWHAIVREAGVHAGGAVAVGLFLAIFLERMQRLMEWPFWVCLAPVVLGCVYACAVFVFCYRRAAAEFPARRRQMRTARMSALRSGGLPRRRWERLTWLRVQLPMWLIMVGGVLLAIRLFPQNDWRPKIFLMCVAGAAMGVSAFLDRWNQRQRPRNLHRLCPRCGYDMTGSAERCPECGLRRMFRATPRSFNYLREEDEETDEDDEDGF